MRIRVFDSGEGTADRYTVYIGKDAYGMSRDADMPNGVCMYLGLKSPEKVGPEVLGREYVVGDMPHGVLVQIINLLVWDYIGRK